MAGVGGYQRPANPAPEGSSGPGKYSKRTDGGPSVDNAKQAAMYISGQDYGQAAEINQIAQSAPLAAAPDVQTLPVNIEPVAPPVDFRTETQRPNEPITAGAPYGPGINGPAPVAPQMSEADRKQLELLYGIVQNAANQSNASTSTVNMARELRSAIYGS